MSLLSKIHYQDIKHGFSDCFIVGPYCYNIFNLSAQTTPITPTIIPLEIKNGDTEFLEWRSNYHNATYLKSITGYELGLFIGRNIPNANDDTKKTLQVYSTDPGSYGGGTKGFPLLVGELARPSSSFSGDFSCVYPSIDKVIYFTIGSNKYVASLCKNDNCLAIIKVNNPYNPYVEQVIKEYNNGYTIVDFDIFEDKIFIVSYKVETTGSITTWYWRIRYERYSTYPLNSYSKYISYVNSENIPTLINVDKRNGAYLYITSNSQLNNYITYCDVNYVSGNVSSIQNQLALSIVKNSPLGAYSGVFGTINDLKFFTDSQICFTSKTSGIYGSGYVCLLDVSDPSITFDQSSLLTNMDYSNDFDLSYGGNRIAQYKNYAYKVQYLPNELATPDYIYFDLIGQDDVPGTSSSSSNSSSSSFDSSSSTSAPESKSSSSSESESSSSSSVSSSSFEYSSSSSADLYRELFTVQIEQGHHNLLPFTFYVESGISNSSTLNFEFNASATYFNYEAIIDTTINQTSSTLTAYVPQDEGTDITHNAVIWVDIMSNDFGGVKEFNVRSQNELYGYETPTRSFNVPLFSWSNQIFGEEGSSTSSLDENRGSVWIGSNNKIYKYEYDSDNITKMYESNVSSEAYNILFHPTKSTSFITQYENLAVYTTDDYYRNGQIVTIMDMDTETNNNNNDILSCARNDDLWSVQSYSGNITKRNPSTLAVTETYTGFDAPFKIVWSKHHNCYLIAGTHVIWKLVNGVKVPFYNVGGYKITDFDCSEYGQICICSIGDTDSMVQVIDHDLYKKLLSKNISDGNARYCKYCQQGIFYILIEKDTNKNYSASNYVFNCWTKTLSITDTTNEVVTTTTTTTLPEPTNTIEIFYPNGSETLEIGSDIEIKWKSIKATRDAVKIDLYRENLFYKNIVGETDNTGIYVWTISEDLEAGTNYRIRITWLSSSNDPANYDTSDNFVLSTTEVTTTTTTTSVSSYAIGIDYNKISNHIVIVLNNGMIGYFDLNEDIFYGMFVSDLKNVRCMAVRKDNVRKYTGVSKARVFVGSAPYLSNKWDSGIVETNLQSMYYGGGNNLERGETYYVNIQVYDKRFGWSEVQTKEWKMPS